MISPLILRHYLVLVLRPWLWFSVPLDPKTLHPNPFVEFARWYKMAWRCFWLEFPDAFCLATFDSEGVPDNRMLLLKDFDMRGFTFFTNYNSQKGKQLLENKSASMTFFWDSLQRQIRIQGQVEICSPEESDAYFQSRSKGSQIAALASLQSQPLKERAELDQLVLDLSSKFNEIDVTRPENWGGFRLVPRKIEFWKARAHRLHDRFLYSLDEQGDWKVTQLYP